VGASPAKTLWQNLRQFELPRPRPVLGRPIAVNWPSPAHSATAQPCCNRATALMREDAECPALVRACPRSDGVAGLSNASLQGV